LVHRLFGAETPGPTDEVTLLDWDPDGEDKVLAAICYPHAHLPESQLLERVRRLPADDRVALMHAYVGERTNRRHKPGRAFAREAMHLCELRSSPQGHPSYRRIAQEMHRLIAERAGHRAIAAAMQYVDHGSYDLERLDAERAAEARRGLRG